MTMSSTVSKVTLLGDGVQTSWPFAFKVWQEADIEVILSDPTGADSVALDWSAVLAGLGGTVTYPTSGPPLPLGWKITIKRAMPFLQEVDLVSGTRWDPEVVETALDQKTAELQQLKEELSRSVKIGITSSGTAEDLLASIYDARDAALASASSSAGSADDSAISASEAAASAVAAELAANSVSVLTASGTLTVGQDTINLPWSYDSSAGNISVFISGVKQVKSTLTFVSDTSVRIGFLASETLAWEVVSTTAASESILTALRDQALDAKDDAESARDTTLAALDDYVTLNGVETLTNKTLTGYIETVYAISGTTPALDPDNGTIQTWTLSANSNPTNSLSSGQSMTLMVADGTGYSITWPTMTWVEGSAPTLATSGYTVIVLWKVGTTLYGMKSGEVA